ncbi:unknown [Clostridium sp. CAG:306]|nr:unknown [Clostridium sp. CAG:306]
MTLTGIISAIGNNNSVYPLIVRDCGIEVPSKIALTYNQNKKESKEIAKLAARERFLDEYAVSAVWLGGIPLVGKVADYFIKKQGYNPDVNLKLFNKNSVQNIDDNIKNFSTKVSKEIIDELKAVKNNKPAYEKLLAVKFAASTTIPILFMGVILPKLIFASSARKIEQQRQKEAQKNKDSFKSSNVNFQKSIDFMNRKNTSFKGSWISAAANFSTVDKMAVTDGGYALGRVGTARNKNEAIDVGFKMAGMMFLNFVAPKYIEKYLDKFIAKTSGLEVALDPLMLNDEEFIESIKNKTLKLPKSLNEKEILEFIDKNPDSIFVKYARKFGKVKFLENNIRDPRAFVDIKDIVKFKENIESFMNKAAVSKSIEKYAKKAKAVKSVNILTNIGLSSFLLAYALPKAQFAFRKLVTGSDLEPGLAPAKKTITG